MLAKIKLKLMKKLIGLRKTKTAIFISGKGSNLKNLIEFSKKTNSPISIELIISNTKKAKGLKYSNQYNILKKIFNFNNTIDEKKLLTLLIKKKIKFICLAGFIKILSKKSLIIFQDPENPKLGTQKTKSQKQRKTYLNGFSKKRGPAKKSRMLKPMSEVHDHSPPPTTHFDITQKHP